MAGFNIVNLADVLKLKNEAEKAHDYIIKAISAFSCPLNNDVENFLKSNSITFAEQNIAATYLVFTSYKKGQVLVAYFTLSNKHLFISKKMIDSNSLRSRIAKFSTYNQDLKGYSLSIPLIAQLGKNFSDGYNELISGDELLKLACDQIKRIQIMLSGKLTYVECEDIDCLVNFYVSNGFRRIANRELNKSEKSESDKGYLVQLVKYIK